MEIAGTIVKKISNIFNQPFSFNILHTSKSFTLLISSLILLCFIFIDPLMDALVKGRVVISKPVSYLIFSSLIVFIILFGYFGETNFIYFQF
jgi:hypothetical protein